MIKSVQFAWPNSLAMVMDPRSGIPPSELNGTSVAVSQSCLAVGTLSGADGETTVSLGSDTEFSDDPTMRIRWKGKLETTGRIALMTVDGDVLLEMRSPTPLTCVTLWTNDPTEPSAVWVGLRELPTSGRQRSGELKATGR